MIKVPIRASSSCVKPPGDNPVRALQKRGGCPAGVCSTVGVVNYFECYYTFLTINSCSGPAPCDDAPQQRANECAGEEVQVSWQVVRSRQPETPGLFFETEKSSFTYDYDL
ncbi:hypothetical protein NQZ68_005707 [Dissostichus eleginoides]|nr:hypothetical protein NQZ68_005707 [Dissostichus eleginoides]